MVTSKSSLEKHNINISHQVWGELKVNAFHERSTASNIVNFLVEDFLRDPSRTDKVSGHRSHDSDKDRLGRSIYFRPDLWQRLQDLSEKEKFSVASAIENMLIDYLGLADQGVTERPVNNPDPNRYVKIGNDVFDLGENPRIIDANTGLLIDKGGESRE